VQANFLRRVLTSQAHIVLLPPDEVARPLHAGPGIVEDAALQRPNQRLRSIDQWQTIRETVAATPGVRVIAKTHAQADGARKQHHHGTANEFCETVHFAVESRCHVRHRHDAIADVLIERGQTLRVRREMDNAIPTIKSQIWPAFPTDMMSVALTVATQCAGPILFHDWMFDGRFFFTDRLVSMGARILLCDPHRALVQGPTSLKGDLVISSPDIRAGMALLIAALSAKGITTIRNIQQIDRGYVRVDEKFRALGAHIQREALR